MTTTMPTSLYRGIPIIPLTGPRSVELQSDWSLPVLLRTFALDAQGTPEDAGNLVFRAWDPENQTDPDGGGYGMQIRDLDSGTLLATGTAAQRGIRAVDSITVPAGLDHNWTTTIVYPDLSDPTISPPTVTRVYTWKDSATASPAAANELLLGTQAENKQALISAINGDADYGDQHVYWGTSSCAELVAVSTAGASLSLEARDGGVWGNLITWDFSNDLAASQDSGTLSGGTNFRGLLLEIDHAQLPNSLVTDGRTRTAWYDVVGLDDGGDPTKICGGPVTLFKSATET